ncbi:MAG: hypothetical protein ACOCXQ_04255 [Patescibacteria group bacterium]
MIGTEYRPNVKKRDEHKNDLLEHNTSPHSIADLNVPAERTYRDGALPNIKDQMYLNGGHAEALFELGLVRVEDVLVMLEDVDGNEVKVFGVTIPISELVVRYEENIRYEEKMRMEQDQNPVNDTQTQLFDALEQQVKQNHSIDYTTYISDLETMRDSVKNDTHKEALQKQIDELKRIRDFTKAQARSLLEFIDLLYPEDQPQSQQAPPAIERIRKLADTILTSR